MIRPWTTSTRMIRVSACSRSTGGAAACWPTCSMPCPDRATNLLAMLVIAQATGDEVVGHARRDHPDEAGGVVAVPAHSDRPERFIPMANAARSPTFYEFDSLDLLQLYREMDDRDEEPVVVYHSHTSTEAYPSRTDVTYANEPNAHYVLEIGR